MKDREKTALVKKAMRNARKAWRSMDSAGERMERRLDRMIDRKTYPSGNEWDPLISDWNTLKSLGSQVEKALADTISVSNF